MKILINILVLAAILSFSRVTLAQCSDAGICSIGHKSEEQNYRISLDYVYGSSGKDYDLTFHSFALATALTITEDSRITIQFPYSRQNGPLGSVAGFGDITAFWTQTLHREDDIRISVQLGAKIAVANINAGNLPQAYQSGLGTNDILVGASYEAGPWNFALGYQYSPGRNENQFARLKRGDDAYINVGYTTDMSEARITGEILAIKRIHESSVVNLLAAQPMTAYMDVPGSDQAQINLLGRIQYPILEGTLLRGMVALPILKRDINVDGLTRSFSFSTGLAVSF